MGKFAEISRKRRAGEPLSEAEQAAVGPPKMRKIEVAPSDDAPVAVETAKTQEAPTKPEAKGQVLRLPTYDDGLDDEKNVPSEGMWGTG